MEGDRLTKSPFYGKPIFQSTPSAWRETSGIRTLCRRARISIHSLRMEGDIACVQDVVRWIISIHSLRMEGDPLLACRSFQCIPISIHSLRMEGDYFSARSVGIVKSFQSTPSAWRETTLRSRKSVHVGISIHSLRMEGDTHKELLSIGFYKISIHSLRMEGDWRSASS